MEANTTNINVGEINADGEGVGIIITKNVAEEDVENQKIHNQHVANQNVEHQTNYYYYGQREPGCSCK